ncbi:MAG: hypothetical protein M1830_008989 [Pleopsidium flavum]|nr:MAG: hypothetical protein M1830_003065 [Pleopsidium flavum]KAI9875039.1 MAG: hypothetical protein M1830_008989 [Pleopsidium flavum]
MAFNYTLPLRAIQALFALIVLGLTAYVAHWYRDDTVYASPSQVNFLIFTSLWTLLALAYLTLTPWLAPRASHKFAILAVEALTMLFWFAGFIALAVFVSRLLVCGGHDLIRCHIGPGDDACPSHTKYLDD